MVSLLMEQPGAVEEPSSDDALHELCKISVSIRGHRTSFSVERAFFKELSALAAGQGMSLSRLVSTIDHARLPGQNLSSAVRLHVLNALKAAPARLTH